MAGVEATVEDVSSLGVSVQSPPLSQLLSSISLVSQDPPPDPMIMSPHPSLLPTTPSPSPISSLTAPPATTVTPNTQAGSSPSPPVPPTPTTPASPSPTDLPFTDIPPHLPSRAFPLHFVLHLPTPPPTPPPPIPPPPTEPPPADFLPSLVIPPPPPITPLVSHPPTPSPLSQSPLSPTLPCRNKKLLLLGYGDEDLDSPGNPILAVDNEVIEGETPPSRLPIISINLWRARVSHDSFQIPIRPRPKNEEPDPINIFGPTMSGPKALFVAAHSPSAQGRLLQVLLLPLPQGVSPLLTTPHHTVEIKENDRGLGSHFWLLAGSKDEIVAVAVGSKSAAIADFLTVGVVSSFYPFMLVFAGQEVQLCGEPPPDLLGLPSRFHTTPYQFLSLFLCRFSAGTNVEHMVGIALSSFQLASSLSFLPSMWRAIYMSALFCVVFGQIIFHGHFFLQLHLEDKVIVKEWGMIHPAQALV